MPKKKQAAAPAPVITYQTKAEPRAYAGDIPVFCAHDELVPIGEARPNPHNPNQHPAEQITALAEIIRAQGWRAPITISRRSGLIVKGHGRLLAAQYLRAELVPIDFQNYDSEESEWADVLADNRLAELSTTDDEKLADMLTVLNTSDIPAMLSGYTELDIAQILGTIAGSTELPEDIDELPEALPEQPISRPGDLWTLGGHRLICGDATDEGTIARLMDGQRAHLVFTDPPYGVAYTGSGRDEEAWEMIANDDLTGDELLNLLVPAFKNMVKYSIPDAAFYIWHGALVYAEFIDAVRAAGMIQKALIVWAKNNFVIRHNDYHQMHEPCIYGEKQGNQARFFGDRTNTTVWRAAQRRDNNVAATVGTGIVLSDGQGNRLFIASKPPKNKKVRNLRIQENGSAFLTTDNKTGTLWEVSKDAKAQHPNQKPVELADRALKNSSQPGEILLDPFGGSGTTLIAAQLNARRAYLCELEPKYVDLIIERYLKLTGQHDAICSRDGETVYYSELINGQGQETAPEHESAVV